MTVIIYQGEDACSQCLGWKRVDDGELQSWKYWAELPPQSQLAIQMGLVRPVKCPRCKGTGVEPKEPNMITIANYSHPLPAGRPDVANVLGLASDDDYRVLEIPVHLEQRQPLRPQCAALLDQAVDLAHGLRNIDVVVLPGLAIAAVLVISEFERRGYCPNILYIAPAPEGVSPRFIATELIHL